jgi:hypothetical protein
MARELRAATVYLTGFGDRAALDRETVARGGAFFPVLGLALGGIAALAARAGGALVADGGAAVAGLAALVLLARAAPLRAVARGAGSLAAVGLLALELGALWVVIPSALGPSLALAGMLGRWASSSRRTVRRRRAPTGSEQRSRARCSSASSGSRASARWR